LREDVHGAIKDVICTPHGRLQVISEGAQQKSHKIMVFCTTARLAGYMAGLFRAARLPGVLEIHSRMSQSKRDRMSQAFRESRGGVIMFTSDVSARGVDYPGTTLVIQVGLPDSRETYVHRLGRTARGGAHGKGVLLLTDAERVYVKRKLEGLPVEESVLPPLEDGGLVSAVTGALRGVQRDAELERAGAQAYQSWLGYMKTHLKLLRWDAERLVLEAAAFSSHMGLLETPALQKKTVRKMGLFGVPGIRLERG
jgi:ATP-dependent RNA helicase MSS116, mitochondrial